VRLPLSLGLALSLSAHALAFAAFYAGRPAEPPPDPPPTSAGETFELPAPDTDVPLANASPSPATVAPAAQAAEDDGPARPQPPVRGRAAQRPSHAGRPSGGRADGHAEASASGTGSSAQYGAVGERSASDLATAFTRAFPQAASADPAWRSASFGSAGDGDVLLTIDESGHLEHTQVLGAPTAALAGGIHRTIALIQGRTFVAHGKVTKLHVTGTVSADSVHDGLHGDVFAIGGSFAGGEGSAFFALAIGRRIDVRVRLR
jgi:hypothetical protein